MVWKIYKRVLKVIAKHIPFYQLRAFLFRMAGYRIGSKVYIGEDLIIIDELQDRGLVTIGDKVAIAPRVTLVVSSTPNFSEIAPYAPIKHGPIIISNNAWLGTGVIVFPNVKIGEGAIIGAGSVVNSDIPPFCIAAGSPARVMRRIGNDEQESRDIGPETHRDKE